MGLAWRQVMSNKNFHILKPHRTLSWWNINYVFIFKKAVKNQVTRLSCSKVKNIITPSLYQQEKFISTNFKNVCPLWRSYQNYFNWNKFYDIQLLISKLTTSVCLMPPFLMILTLTLKMINYFIQNSFTLSWWS